jgi:hypothetical protein
MKSEDGSVERVSKLANIFLNRIILIFLFGFFILLTIPRVTDAYVVINEISWFGSDWIELYNSGNSPVDLTGWSLWETNSGTTSASAVQSCFIDQATGASLIVPEGYLLITGFSGNVIPSYGLLNSGEQLILKDSSGIVIDMANLPATKWFAGKYTSSPTTFYSMERNLFTTTPPEGTLASSWHTSDGTVTWTTNFYGTRSAQNTPNPTPIPAAVWLFGTGLIGLVGIRRKFKK